MNLPLTPAWRARILAVVAGIGAGLAHPPFGLIVGIAAYGLLMWLAETDGPKPLRWMGRTWRCRLTPRRFSTVCGGSGRWTSSRLAARPACCGK